MLLQVQLKAVVDALHVRQVPLILGRIGKRALRDGAKQLHRVVIDLLPELTIEPAKQLDRIRMPDPPQVVGQLQKRLQLFGNVGKDLESSNCRRRRVSHDFFLEKPRQRGTPRRCGCSPLPSVRRILRRCSSCSSAGVGQGAIFLRKERKMYSMPRFSRRLFLATSAFGAAAWMASRLGLAGEPLDDSPDRRRDPEFLQHGIKEISDEDLFAAMDLSKPGLQKVREPVEK